MPPPTGPIDVPLSLFSGLVTELSPSDLPEGTSPDNQDVVYVPGGVASRPCLHKLFGVPFAANPHVNYCKSYRQPNGNPLNFYLDALGVMRVEDVVNTPGQYATLASVCPGCFCNSVTAQNGKEYFAFSDGVRPLDIPRQYDGTFFDRVSQDGPAAAPAVADYSATVGIISITLGGSTTSIVASPNGASETGNVVTITTTANHGFLPGQTILVFGIGVAGYNGVITIQTVPSLTSFTYTVATAGLAASGGGNVAQYLSVSCATPDQLNVGDSFQIAGSKAADNSTPYDNNVNGNPAFWTVAVIVNSAFFQFVPAGMTTIPAAANINTLGGNVAVGGLSAAGQHQCVQMFLTRQGYLTKPSPPFVFSSSGNKQWNVTSLAIGPPNVVARVLAFTGAGGGNFFTILSTVNLPNAVLGATSQTVIKALIIPDNTSTSALVDVSDNALFGSTGIDIPGNNLFNQVVLAPCIGVKCYANRLMWYGEWNKVQRFINMGFEGGTAAIGGANPLGWTIATAGGVLVAAPVDFGLAWQITGDGSANARGQISQTAYQNNLGNAILNGNTPYTFVCWAQAQLANQAGQLIAELFSQTQGSLAKATIQMNAIPTIGGFVQANFSVNSPVVIPADAVLRIYATNLVNGQIVTVDEMMLVFTVQPFRDNVFRCSYTNNLEAYDGVTGTMGPASDPTPIRDGDIVRDTFYFCTGERVHYTRDSTTVEPAGWDVRQIDDKCGGVSTRCMVKGNNWLGYVSQNDSDLSLVILDGGATFRISQEMQPNFSSINQDAMSSIWAVNDAGGGAKRIYVGVPIGASVSPNQIIPLDYRELDTADIIVNHPPIHISLTGKMVCSDLSRKWTRWNLAMNCGAILNRSKNRKQFCVGGNFGNVYFFDPLKLTDDDYGQMNPYYTTYAFVNHDMEQGLTVGVHRKLYDKLSLFVSGVGLLNVQPLADSLSNAVPFTSRQGGSLANSIPLQAAPKHDTEIPGEVSAERCFFKISVTPIQLGQPGYTNGTDVQFTLSHMSVRLQAHPVSPLRGSI